MRDGIHSSPRPSVLPAIVQDRFESWWLICGGRLVRPSPLRSSLNRNTRTGRCTAMSQRSAIMKSSAWRAMPPSTGSGPCSTSNRCVPAASGWNRVAQSHGASTRSTRVCRLIAAPRLVQVGELRRGLDIACGAETVLGGPFPRPRDRPSGAGLLIVGREASRRGT
jgi:hypothetical protein